MFVIIFAVICAVNVDVMLTYVVCS